MTDLKITVIDDDKIVMTINKQKWYDDKDDGDFYVDGDDDVSNIWSVYDAWWLMMTIMTTNTFWELFLHYDMIFWFRDFSSFIVR